VFGSSAYGRQCHSEDMGARLRNCHKHQELRYFTVTVKYMTGYKINTFRYIVEALAIVNAICRTGIPLPFRDHISYA